MASKGMKNLFGGFKSAFGKSDPVEKKKEEHNAVAQLRESERQMIAQLKQIKLNDPQNKLSQAKIKELNIPGVIAYAVEELSYPLIIDFDLSNLDKNIDYIIKALEDAIKEGKAQSAEWACTALVFAIKDLRTDIAGVDREYSKEIMECRVQYSENLVLLVKSCQDYDYRKTKLDDQLARRKKARDELDKCKNYFQTRRDSGALDLQMAELEQNAHNPAALSDAARDLRDELHHIHMLKSSLIEIDTIIDADKVTLNSRASEITSRRNTLSSPPHVTDPKLQDRINEANRRYRDALRRQLNEAEEAMRQYDVHISAMSELANHSVHITSVAKAIEMAKEMELERYHQMLAEQQAEEMRIRASQNLQAIKETIKAQEQIHEQPLVNIIQEPEHEHEVIQNVEYDFG